MVVDYSCRIRCAEEVVGGIIDDILTEGGHVLWQKYLQRKAFPFAAETATDALVSNLRMCFVAHDRGEDSEPEDWSLEEEPAPGVVDSWARMHLDVRRPKHNQDEYLPKANRTDRRFQTMRTRVSDARRTKNAMDKHEKEERGKTYALKEEVQVDEEEEKLRNARQEEEQRRRERENKARANEKAKELEQQRVQAMHEEMARKQHTFDSDGGLIWVEEIKFERLPKVQEVFTYNVKRDPRDRRQEAPQAAAPKAKQQPRGRRLRFGDTHGRGQNKAEDDFPDGFSKLQHGQPPILETMVVKPGVVLDVYGKSKAGPAVGNTGGGMSRKEYVALAEKEVAYEAQFASMSDPSAEGPGAEAVSPTGAASPPASRGFFQSGSQPNLGSGPSGGLGGDAGPFGLNEGGVPGGLGDASLPPIHNNSGHGQKRREANSRGASRGLGDTGPTSSKQDKDSEVKVQTAPPAPSQQSRSKKMEAVGHLGKPPRLHVAPLGGPYGFGVAQPPLGATMGHGLVRAGSTKEAYFFPNPSPDMPSLLRASSEAALGPSRRRTPATAPPSRGGSREDSRMGPDGAMRDDEDSPRHGLIKVDKKSQAYRGMRQVLFPNTLSSGYVSGML